jgi:hypothetical protein
VVDCYVFITPTPKELLLTPSRRLHVEILVLRLFFPPKCWRCM